MHSQRLFERAVKYRIARRVGEVGEQDGVFLGQRRRAIAENEKRDGGDCQNRQSDSRREFVRLDS